MKIVRKDWLEANGKKADLVIEGPTVNVKDAVIGIAAIGAGVCWLLRKAFKNGANAFDRGEYKGLQDIGCIDQDDGEH